MTTLYIHIPFCYKKCFYCSFVVFVGGTRKVNFYLQCLQKEAHCQKKKRIQSIYIGGGTPSFLKEDELEKLFQIIQKSFIFDSDIECTLEANPEMLNVSKLKLFKKHGVNRLSLGIQSLNDQFLAVLGRNHNRNMALKVFNDIRKVGFENVNVDLMYGFPGQSSAELKKDVRGIARLGSEHVSLYALTIEKNSRFYTKKISLPDPEIQSQQYGIVCDLLGNNGFKQYEISNFAKPGFESFHNLNYWRGGNYIGLGVGAHSHHNGRRSWNVSRLSEYFSRIQSNRSPREGQERLTKSQRYIETLLFGLRINEGVDMSKLQKEFKWSLDPKRKKIIQSFVENGFLVSEKNRLQTTVKGRIVLDELCSRII